jgi:hypothetical protein
MTDDVSDVDELGPIDYLIIEFPQPDMRGEGLPLLADLVDRGIIKILDLTFVSKDEDGTVTGIDFDQFDPDGQLQLEVFKGASSGLLGDDDLVEAAKALEPGTSAGVLVYENRWAAPFVAALHRNGAQVVASGRIPASDLIEALELAGSAG